MLKTIVFQSYLHENRNEKMSDGSQRFRFFGNALARHILNEFHLVDPPFDRAVFLSIVLVKKRTDKRVLKEVKSISVVLERQFEDLQICQNSQNTSKIFYDIIGQATDFLDVDEKIGANFLIDGLDRFVEQGFETSWCLQERSPQGLKATFRLEARMTVDFLEVFFVALRQSEEVYRERIMLTIPSDVYLEGSFKKIVIEDGMVSIPGTIASYFPSGSLDFDMHPTLPGSEKLISFRWSRRLSDILGE